MSDSPYHQLYHQPKPKDLFIPGELLKIEFHFNSFTVHFQLPGVKKYEYQLQVLKRTYPIQNIQNFFQENGKYESKKFAHRPSIYWEKS